VFGALPATKCGLEFFPHDKVVFASDCPFDPEMGSMYPRLPLAIFEKLDLSKTDRKMIYYKNLEAITEPAYRKLVMRTSNPKLHWRCET
jgi:aminocarboxymuconate-semialdehyde decarboxylase